MRRRTFDILMSMGGLALTITLVVVGSLAFVGYNFANDNVTTQLAQQKIFFPPKGPATANPEIGPFIDQYAGQQLTTGAQAEAYANHFIAVHVKGIADGKTYAEMGAVIAANPDDKTLVAQRDSIFKGETLRGLLLQAYAFWKVGQIALIGAIVAWVMAGILALLTILGFWHLRRVTPEEEVLVPHIKSHAMSA